MQCTGACTTHSTRIYVCSTQYMPNCVHQVAKLPAGSWRNEYCCSWVRRNGPYVVPTTILHTSLKWMDDSTLMTTVTIYLILIPWVIDWINRTSLKFKLFMHLGVVIECVFLFLWTYSNRNLTFTVFNPSDDVTCLLLSSTAATFLLY